MKKNFFKKLSFVLALAMIVSVIAPAAGVFAAAATKINSTSRVLYLGEDGKNEFDFNVINKVKGSTYAWESSNENVAVVDEKSGLTTAVGVGTSTISLAIAQKDGKELTLSAKVYVKDNIAEIKTVYMQTQNAPALDQLKVNVAYDFGRTYVTKSGAATGTTSVTRWFVDKADKATVDTLGVFKATEAGTYNITAVAFATSAKYDAWKALNDTTSTLNVLATKTIEVKVVNEIAKVVESDLNTVKVTFTSPVTDAAKEIKVSKLVGTTKVPVAVKEVKAVDAAKNVEFTVDVYADFTAEATYVVDYKDLKSAQFVAAKTVRDQVASMTVSTTQVTVGSSKNLLADVKLFNADGVDITNSTIATTGNITFATTSTKAYISGSNVSMFKAGDTAAVTATWHSQKYNYTTGAEEGNLVVTVNLVAVDPVATAITTLNAWTITTAATADFTTVKHDIYVGEAGHVAVQANTNDTVNNTKVTTGFTYESSNNSVLIADATGNLYPVKEGTAIVVVYYTAGGTTKVFDAITVNVKAAKTASDIKLDSYAFALSNQLVDNTKTVTAKVVDQYGNESAAGTLTVEKVITAQIVNTPNTSVAGQVTFNTTGMAAGLYPFKVTLGNFSKIVNVTVNAPTTGDTTFKLKLSNTSFDLAATKDSLTKALNVSVLGYAPNGVAVTSAALSGAGYRVAIDAPGTGTDVTASNGTYDLAVVTGGAVVKQPVGNYTVTLYKTVTVDNVSVEIVIDQAVFTVTDSQSAPVVASVKSAVYTKSDLKDIVFECFKITWDGTEIAATAIQSVDAVGTVNTNNYYIKSVVVRQYITSGSTTAYVEKTVNIGLNVSK